LQLAGKLGRFNQTAIALLLSGLLLDLLALPLVSWYQRTQSVESGLLMLILLFWGIVVIGHIIRHAFDINLGLGVAASVLYTLVSLNLANWLFPVAA
jgi:lipopolysaccharide export LptBFGC system permease protein LptF